MNTFLLEKEALTCLEKDNLEWTINTAGFEVKKITNVNTVKSFYFYDAMRTYTRVILSNDIVIYGRLSGIIFSQKTQSYSLEHFDKSGYFSFFSSELRNSKQKNACSATSLGGGYFDLSLHIKIPFLSRQLAEILSGGKNIDCKFPLLIHFIVLYKDDFVDDFFTQPFYSIPYATIYNQIKKEKKIEQPKKKEEKSQVDPFFLCDEIQQFPQIKKPKKKKDEC